MNGKCEDYARCGSDTAGVTDRVHRSGGSRVSAPYDYETAYPAMSVVSR
jgi:hypothetical protein